MRPATPPPSRVYARRREAPLSRDYLEDKVVKRKSAKKAAWMIVLAFVVFGFFLTKFAMSDYGPYDGFPNSDTAYGIARQYIKPMLRAGNVRFADDNYKFAKKSDSVYVIKSSYTTKFDDGENQTTHFTITLKYRGGMGAKIGNWDMVSLDQDN
ncbi:MAG: hypothetical protein JKY70_11190 [Mucilaginibacter sp.]|nr:hypothetical protein [Mucilaginibacter sp.]